MKPTAKIKKKNILIIGAGRLGTALASVLSVKPVPDLRVRYIASRTEKSLIKAKKIIGKHGRTARAMRTVVSAAASKERKRAVLEILEGNRPERRNESDM